MSKSQRYSRLQTQQAFPEYQVEQRVARQTPTLLLGRQYFLSGNLAGESSSKMETRLYVGNLSKSTTQEELNTLFAQAGNVTAVEVIKERKSGESKGFAFVTMSEQNEADQAVSMFNAYSLSDHALKVSPAKPREEQAGKAATIEP
jgi:RNA recognition motif-containing protein